MHQVISTFRQPWIKLDSGLIPLIILWVWWCYTDRTDSGVSVYKALTRGVEMTSTDLYMPSCACVVMAYGRGGPLGSWHPCTHPLGGDTFYKYTLSTDNSQKVTSWEIYNWPGRVVILPTCHLGTTTFILSRFQELPQMKILRWFLKYVVNVWDLSQS